MNFIAENLRICTNFCFLDAREYFVKGVDSEETVLFNKSHV
jgi:hypothetical protein